MTDEWISAETERKEADFRGILRMHINVCKGILGRSSSAPYLYADLYAGPGHLTYEGREFLGSPLIAQELLTRAGIRHESIHFEQDPEVAGRLREALWVPRSLIDVTTPESAPVREQSCQNGLPQWLDEVGRQPDRYGLVYADPIRDEIPHELLNRAAEALPRVDLLSYVSATQYKRRRGTDSARPFLASHIRAVDKKVVLIRKPAGAWQWTFVLWSNWVDLPSWEQRGFFRLDSDTGSEILDYLNLNKEQYRELRMPSLFPAGGGA